MSIAPKPGGETAATTAEPGEPVRALRGVLVPLDGSALAEQALSVGASLARRAAAPLHLISVVEPVLEVVRREFPDRATTETDSETSRRRVYLDQVAEMVRAARPGVVGTTVLSGDPAEAIAGYAARERLDFVVLTTHGRGRVARWSFGSVAEALLQRCQTPLLILHPGEPPRLGEYRRIVVGLDGEHDRRVLDAARRLGSTSPGARYVLVAVVESEVPLLTPLALHPHHPGKSWQDRRVAEAEVRVGTLAQELESQGIPVTRNVIGRRSVARALRDIGRSAGADCLVVGTHGLSGVDRAMIGSVALKLMRETELPLLVVPLKPAG
jgi:nucleotide-binding universal stress UspA family protein